MRALLTLVVASLGLVAAVTLPRAVTPRQAMPNGMEMRPALQTPPINVEQAWEQGRQLMRRGDYPAAADLYADLAARGGVATVPRALLQEGRAARADGDGSRAVGVLERLVTDTSASAADFAQAPETLDGLFALGLARRTNGDCAGALAAFVAYEQRAGPAALGPYPALQRAACSAVLADPRGQLEAARQALAIDAGGPRLARIEALEKAAEASARLGNPGDALDFYDRAFPLAGTPSYRAELLFTTGTLARATGRTDLARDRLRAVVVDYPEQSRASEALSALDDLGLGATISPLQAGLVYVNARDYQAAARILEQVPPADVDWPAAAYNHALALLRLGSTDDAVAELLDLAESTPAWSGRAILRAGAVLERDDHYPEAEAAYLGLPRLAPGGEAAATALVRAGVARMFQGQPDAALAAWDQATAVDSGAPPPVLAQAHFWSGKVLASRARALSEDARDALQRAVAAAPTTFYGARARDLLEGNDVPRGELPRSGADGLVRPARTDQRERVAWLEPLKLDATALDAEIAADPGLRRAVVLLEHGLKDEAMWEVDGLWRRIAANRDVPRLNAVAAWLKQHDLADLALVVGRQQLPLLRADLPPPVPVERDLYPAGWGDLAAEQAARFGVDPFLLLGLVRQESAFNPRAQSSARASGLTQVIPDTGREIARRLGRAETFQNSDLFHPGTSLEFGAWYLRQQLDRYGGRILPALAAYNAGPGNADRWLSEFGDDPDVFVERIPFAETQGYVKLVYENYRAYQRLYG